MIKNDTSDLFWFTLTSICVIAGVSIALYLGYIWMGKKTVNYLGASAYGAVKQAGGEMILREILR